MRHAAALLSAFLCIWAGFMLLAIDGGNGRDGLGKVFADLAHGVGVYCLGKGLFVGAALWPPAPPRSPDAIA